MSKKTTIALAAALVLLMFAALFVYLRPMNEQAANTSQPLINQPNGKTTPPSATEPVPDTTTLEFEKSVSLDEPVTVDIRFRDYSQLPYEYTDYQAEVGKLPAMPGKATITFKSFKIADSLGAFRPEPGFQLVYVTYEISGDSANPEGSRIMPNLPFSGDPDMAPQPVLVSGERTFRVEASDFEKLKNFLYLDHPTHMQYHSSGPWTYGAMWERPVGYLPIVALEYMPPDGQRRLIRLDY